MSTPTKSKKRREVACFQCGRVEPVAHDGDFPKGWAYLWMPPTARAPNGYEPICGPCSRDPRSES